MKDFLFLTHTNHDAFFNLASEEYLLKKKGGNYIYIWQNAPAVICGINQNTLSEVNLNYTNENGIKVVRRLTGGGAVYHDLGNICYTVIAPFNEQKNYYREFTKPIIKYLKTLGVTGEFSGRNDICVDGRKISGNAQTVYKDKIMHHGTILFDTDLSVLTNALNPNKLKTQSKGIKSVRSRVANIKEFLPDGFSIDKFLSGLKDFLKKDCEEYIFSEQDLAEINKLREEKYSTYEWNIGYSPVGSNRIDMRFPFGIMTVCFDLQNGLIQNAQIFGDFFSSNNLDVLSGKLNGLKFEQGELENALKDISEYIVGADAKTVTSEILKQW